MAGRWSNQRLQNRPRPLGFSNVVSNTWGGRKRRAGAEGGRASREGGELTSAGEYYGLSSAGCCFSAPGSGRGGKRRVNMELSAVGERVFAAEALLKRRIRKVGDGDSGRRRGGPSLTRARAPSPCCSPASLPPGPSSGRGRGGGGGSAPALFLDLQRCTDCMDGGRGGGMNASACTLCSVSAGVLQRAGAFGGSVPSIHLVHAFSRVFLVSSSCIPLHAHTHTHTFSFLHPQGRMEYLVKWKGWSQK